MSASRKHKTASTSTSTATSTTAATATQSRRKRRRTDVDAAAKRKDPTEAKASVTMVVEHSPNPHESLTWLIPDARIDEDLRSILQSANGVVTCCGVEANFEDKGTARAKLMEWLDESGLGLLPWPQQPPAGTHISSVYFIADTWNY